jgi:hypothetical protein
MKTIIVVVILINVFVSTIICCDSYEKSIKIEQLEKDFYEHEQFTNENILFMQNQHMKLQVQVKSLAKQDGEILDIIGILNKQMRY